MTDWDDPFLFEGEVVNGRLSNEIWLMKNCPPDFRGDGEGEAAEWVTYVRRLCAEGSNVEHWEYRERHVDVPEEMLEKVGRHVCIHCHKLHVFFDGLYHPTVAERLGVGRFISIAAWMLANMLSEVPEIVAYPWVSAESW